MISPEKHKDLILSAMESGGFFNPRVFDPKGSGEYLRASAIHPPTKATHFDSALIESLFVPGNSIIIAGFPCNTLPVEDADRGIIAPIFNADYYKEAVTRLKNILKVTGEQTGLPHSSIRIFCNSRLPEKPIAALSGMGFYGKNSLIISPPYGSLFVLAGVIIPRKLPTDICQPEAEVPGKGCGDCSRCMEACPVSAITSPGVINLNRCIQALSTRYEVIPEDIMEQWGRRIYGCQTCQDVCPFNRKAPSGLEISQGKFGAAISLGQLLRTGAEGGEEGVRGFFKGTALGMKWMPPLAFLRNSIIAAGNSRSRELLPYLLPFRDHPDPVLRKTAEWAAGRRL
jgi:epoxyqueuosine reductase